MNPRLLDLLREQQAGGFSDVAGAEASVTLPLSDRLVTRLAVEGMPPTAPIRDLDLRAHDGNRFVARVQLTRPAWVPPVSLNLQIHEQPQFPDRPFLVLRLATGGGLLSMAGSTLRFLNVLPPFIRVDGDFVIVDLAALLARQGLADALRFVKHLEITTDEQRFIVHALARIPFRGA